MKKGFWALLIGLFGLLAAGCGESVAKEDPNATPPVGEQKPGGPGGNKVEPN